MLLLLARRRVKAFPKVIAIIESVLRSPFGAEHRGEIIEYLDSYLQSLSKNAEANTYLIAWISYFLVSNGLRDELSFKPSYNDPVARSVFNNRGALFKDAADFRLFEGSRAVGKRASMLEYLDVFNPPLPT